MLRLLKALLLALAIAVLPLHAAAVAVCDSEAAQQSQAAAAPVDAGGEHALHCNLCVAHCAAISAAGCDTPSAVPAETRAAMSAAPPPAFILDTLDRPPLALLR